MTYLEFNAVGFLCKSLMIIMGSVSNYCIFIIILLLDETPFHHRVPSVNRLGVLLLPPGRDASSSQGYPCILIGFPDGASALIYTPGPSCSKVG